MSRPSARRLDLRPEGERPRRGRRPVSASEYAVVVTRVASSPAVAELAERKLGEALRSLLESEDGTP